MSAWIKTAVQPRLTFPTLTGSIVTFNAQYALPLKSHTVDIDSASGVSAININATNTNLFNGDYLAAMLARQGGTIDAVNKTVTYTGAQARNAGVIVKGLFKANTQYTIFAKLAEDSEVTTTNIRVVYTDSTSTQMNNYSKGSLDCKITSANKTIDYIEFAWITGPTKAYYDYFGCIEGALTVDDFIPSNGTYKHIDIGSTVNEATYNARTGVLEVTQPSVQTIQLPSCPIDVLEGVNNIWADTGDTTLQYPKFG